jgi:hypothetical protein
VRSFPAIALALRRFRHAVGATFVGVWDLDKFELVDAPEVVGIHGIQRQSSRDGGGGDHCVVSARAGLASCTSEFGGHLAEGSSGRCIERERVEIGFGLLEMRLPGRTLRVGLGDQWADRQLGRVITAVIIGTAGRRVASVSRGRRTTVLVSRIPCSLTGMNR